MGNRSFEHYNDHVHISCKHYMYLFEIVMEIFILDKILQNSNNGLLYTYMMLSDIGTCAFFLQNRAPAFIGLKTMGKDMSPDHLQLCISAAFESLSKDRINKLASPCSGVSTCASKGTHAGLIYTAKEDQLVANSLVCELMVHPGKRTRTVGGCGNGPDDFSQSSDRELEMTVLMSKEMLDFYKNNDISLVAFQYCMETFT